jgi:mannitol operon transcriptional antiterminator
MITLTTRQRDILRIILEGKKPVSSVELATLLNITPRQVNYSIQGVKIWLNQNNQDLKTLPGAGFALELVPDQARKLFQVISVHSNVQVVLSVSQRQQLLALFLLSQVEPIILSQLEQRAQVSRMTITKDLDEIETWLIGRMVTLVRKPHFGIQVSGAEQDIQQALAEVLWGETSFSGDPIVRISHANGLVFRLEGDAKLLPLVEYARLFLEHLNIRRTIGLVAKAEEQLGGRFTDDAVLYLALAIAILAKRVQGDHHLAISDQQSKWLQKLPIWSVAGFIARRLGRDTNSIWKPGDVAGIAMQMMAAPRNEILPGEMEQYDDFSVLTEGLLDYISQAFGIGKLKHDRTLQVGLLTYIVPACFRQRFHIWFPVSLTTPTLPEQDERETTITNEIGRMVFEYTDVTLPGSEVDNLVVLLRAAIIRNRTYRFERIIVVCPSGMATAQLLVARLNARFPYLNNLEVTSLRDLTPTLVASADLILTTVPLPRQFAGSPNVMLIHPLLMSADIEAITKFLS